MSGCITGKAGYYDEREAERALGRVRARRQRYGDKMGSRRGLRIEHRTYVCPACGNFHATSQSRAEFLATAA